jgi:CheY-like chemotaxis protein
MDISALVVDPHPDRGQAYVNVCSQAGLVARLAVDGQQANTVLAASPPLRIMIIQLSLPMVDGFDVIARYREKYPGTGGARLIAVSSFADLRTTARALRRQLSIDAVLFGATPLDAMLRTIQTVLTGAPAQLDSLREMEAATAPSMPGPPPDEADRRAIIDSARLRQLPVRPPNPTLQRFVSEVSQRCQSPIALMTLALDDKLVFPARHGIDATEVDRYSSLCNKVIEAGEPLFVPDAKKSHSFQSNGLVTAGVIRGYASAPVRLDVGPVVGTLCLINSHEPLTLGLDQVRSLRNAARELGQMIQHSSTTRTS